MSFTRAHFLRYKPWLYHFTDPMNLDSLRDEPQMLSAAGWVSRANEFDPGQIPDPHDFLRTPRLSSCTLRVSATRVVILNDQRPLQHRTSFFRLQGTYEDYLHFLNGLVFFWPGNDGGPTPRGGLAKSFGARYKHYAVLRIATADVWSDASTIRFCRYNSGAPQARDGTTRGPQIFVSHENMDTRHVAEVVFDHQLNLPIGVQWRAPDSSRWATLSDRS
jgi:hypothetical protein